MKELEIFRRLMKIYGGLGDEHRETAYYKLIKKLEMGEIEGVSKKSKEKIEEIRMTGSLKLLDKLERDPKIQARLKLKEILGFGPVKAKNLVDKGIMTRDDIIRSGIKLSELQKFGLQFHHLFQNSVTEGVSDKIICILESGDNQVFLAGSSRLGKKDPGDLDLIIINQKGKIRDVISDLVREGALVDYVKMGEEEIMAAVMVDGKFYKVDIKCTTRRFLASYLLYFGSGKYFSKWIRGIAKKRGVKLNQYGIVKNDRLKTFKEEKEIFDYLGIDYIPPEERGEVF